jgi:predicted PurR-regulated permease PerM
MTANLELKLIPTLLFLIFTMGILIVLWPFSSAIIWAIIVAILLLPLQKYFERKWRKPWLATSLTLIIFTVIILLPASLVLRSVINQAHELYTQFSGQDFSKLRLPESITSLPLVGNFLEQKLQHYLQDPEAIKMLTSKIEALPLVNQSTVVISHFFHTLICFLLMYLLLAFLLYNQKKNELYINNFCSKYLGSATMYQKIIVLSVRGIGLGFLTVGVSIGVIMTIVYISVGLPVPLLLGLITALLSIIPFVLPAFYALLFIFLLIQGNLAAAIVVLSIGLVLNIISDNWLQPYVIGKHSKMHFLITLFGILGGVQMLGLPGIFIGPISLAIGQTILQSRLKSTV